MRALDMTYKNEYGHKAGIDLTDYGSDDDAFYVETWDWFTDKGSVFTTGVVQKSDLPKLIEFLQSLED